MNMNHQPPGEDALDEAIAAYRAAGIPELPEGLAAGTAALLAERVARPADPRNQWRKRMIRNVSVGTAAAMLLSLGAVLWFGSPSPANELNLAINKAAAASSVRAESKTTFAQGGIKGDMTMKTWSEGNLVRIEMEEQGIATIADGKTRKGILVNSKMKTYSPLDLAKLANEGQAKDAESVVKSLELLKDKPIDATEEEVLDGVKTRVYTLKGIKLESLKMTMDCKLWVDRKTNLPVRQEATMKNDTMTVLTVTRFLGYDEKLDPKLFRMDPPEGYKEMDFKQGK